MKYWILYSLAAIAIGYLLVGWVAYMLFWPVKTLEVKNYDPAHPIPVDAEVYYPGENLSYQLDYCKYFDGRATVHRTLVDGQIVQLQDTMGGLPLGCRVITVKTAIIPETITPGRYYLDVVVEYELNPLRTERVHYQTDYFTVAERPEPLPVQAMEKDGEVIYVPVYPASTSSPETTVPDVNVNIENHPDNDVRITPSPAAPVEPEPEEDEPEATINLPIRLIPNLLPL